MGYGGADQAGLLRSTAAAGGCTAGAALLEHPGYDPLVLFETR
jgi:hypothetical protein